MIETTILLILLLGTIIFWFFCLYDKRPLYIHIETGDGYYLVQKHFYNHKLFFILESTKTGGIISVEHNEFIKNFRRN